MSKSNNKSQYEKLLSGTPLSAPNAVGSDQEAASDSGCKRSGGLRTAQLSQTSNEKHLHDHGPRAPRDKFPTSRTSSKRGAADDADDSNVTAAQPLGLPSLSTKPKALAQPPRRAQVGGAKDAKRVPPLNRAQAQGQHAARPELQPAATLASRRKPNPAAAQLQGESGATSSTYPEISHALIQREGGHDDQDGAQSSSSSPRSKPAATGRETQNFFALSGRKSEEDEGDLDQLRSTRALRNKKLLGSD